VRQRRATTPGTHNATPTDISSAGGRNCANGVSAERDVPLPLEPGSLSLTDRYVVELCAKAGTAPLPNGFREPKNGGLRMVTTLAFRG